MPHSSLRPINVMSSRNVPSDSRSNSFCLHAVTKFVGFGHKTTSKQLYSSTVNLALYTRTMEQLHVQIRVVITVASSVRHDYMNWALRRPTSEYSAAQLDVLRPRRVNLNLLHWHVRVHVGYCKYRLSELLRTDTGQLSIISSVSAVLCVA